MTESPATDEAPSSDAAVNGANKRQHNRIPIEADVDFVSESNFYNGFAENISEGGLFIATYERKKIGDKVALKFRLPDSTETIECDGEVRWIREHNESNPEVPPGLGIRFLDMSAEQQARVEDFIREREPLFYDE